MPAIIGFHTVTRMEFKSPIRDKLIYGNQGMRTSDLKKSTRKWHKIHWSEGKKKNIEAPFTFVFMCMAGEYNDVIVF
jgi:hypothetical protein